MKCKRTLSGILSVLLLLCVLDVSASAYKLIGLKWSSSTINYYYDNFVAADAKNAVAVGSSNWNQAGIDATLRFSGNPMCVYCADVNKPDVEWDGMTLSRYNENTNRFTYQALHLNSAKKTWNVRGALNSVSSHEFGHVFGLNDNGTTQTLMNGYTWGPNSRWEGYGISAPTRDDINGVNSLY